MPPYIERYFRGKSAKYTVVFQLILPLYFFVYCHSDLIFW